MHPTRRRVLCQLSAASLAGPGAAIGLLRARPTQALVKEIDRRVIFPGRQNGTTWFHPRACMVPQISGKGRRAVMTLQTISGSDVFGQVHWTYSDDLGKQWSDPKPIDSLGRQVLDGEMEVGVCDVVPEYHRPTDRVLAIGHNVYYEKGVLARPQRQRWPVYVTRSLEGQWSEATPLMWHDQRASQIVTCGCAQRVTLGDGNLLIPISFAPRDRKDRSASTWRCSFDGERLKILEVGNELNNRIGRGLLEPTLAVHKDRFFMSLRAEDERGYVSVSDDGLNWNPPQPWTWDDGEPLVMSTTQQRWLPHSESLVLVYTRKADANVNVMRWRAPLYMAKVDTDAMRLIRSSEQVVFPLIGDGIDGAARVARMGNFHTVAATPEESWVTVGEARPNDRWAGDTLLARIRWSRPNQQASFE